jgi:Protein of unknown function (DUF4232)
MPGIDERLRDAIDRLGTAPDADLIVRRVRGRTAQIRLRRRVQTVALVAAVLIGVIGGVYALLRTFGVGVTNPVPATTPPAFTASPTPSHTAPSPSPSASPSPSTSASATVCGPPSMVLTVDSSSGAAGTLNTVWRVTNNGTVPCSSFGYPTMDVHGSGGWLGIQVQHGGFPNINEQPARVVVQPGGSAYFGSYWSDATTQQGPCTQFDRVRVTLPGATAPVEVATGGCLAPDSVRVGPITNAPPS